MFLCPRSRLRIWSRETGSAVLSRIGLLISILELNLVLPQRDSSRFPRRRPSLYLYRYAIGSVPSLSSHAIAYRCRSLPRVRRHRASKPQGRSSNGCCLCITIDQLRCASLSHTHYWYEVGMLEVSLYHTGKIFYRNRCKLRNLTIQVVNQWLNSHEWNHFDEGLDLIDPAPTYSQQSVRSTY